MLGAWGLGKRGVGLQAAGCQNYDLTWATLAGGAVSDWGPMKNHDYDNHHFHSMTYSFMGFVFLKSGEMLLNWRKFGFQAGFRGVESRL